MILSFYSPSYYELCTSANNFYAINRFLRFRESEFTKNHSLIMLKTSVHLDLKIISVWACY